MKLEDIDRLNLDYDYVVPINRGAWAFINDEKKYLQLWEEPFLEKFLPNIISDSALVANANKLVDYYKENNNFPRILFFGVASGDYDINLVIEHLAIQIQELLRNKYKKSIIYEILKNSNYYMSYFFYKNRNCREFAYFYKDETFLQRRAKFNFDRRFDYMDSCINIMMNSAFESDIFPYIYSENVNAKSIKIDSNKYKNYITYNYLSSHNKIDFLKKNNNIKAIYATSMFYSDITRSDSKYVVNATVIIHNISDKETRLLFSAIRDIGIKKGYDRDFFSMLDELYSVKEKKLFNEWISFILSQALINEFNNEYNIRQELNIDKINKMEKYFKFGDKNVRNYILKCISDPIFTGKDDLDYYLSTCLDTERNVTKFDNSVLKSNSLIDDIDNYFYNKIFDKYDIADYGTCDFDNYILNPNSCSVVVDNLLKNKNEEDIRIGISHILNLCRLNIVDICNQTPTYYENVVGYTQCLKTSFLAIYLYNFKYFELGSIINLAASIRERGGLFFYEENNLNFEYRDYIKCKTINYYLLSGKLPEKIIDDISIFHARCTRLGYQNCIFPATNYISVLQDPNVDLSVKEEILKKKESVIKIKEELEQIYKNKTLYNNYDFDNHVDIYQKKFSDEYLNTQVIKLVKKR